MGEFNVGLDAVLKLLFPLGISFEGLVAQIDALLSIGLGPFQAELGLQFNASLAAQATLTLQIGDPTLSLQLALSALAQLQAALTAALAFPPINLSLSAELSASAALAAALSARLGILSVAIELALKIKIAGLKLLLDTLDAAGTWQGYLSAGPAWGFSFDHDSGADSLADIGAQINNRFSVTGVGTGGDAIAPGDTNVYGLVLLCQLPVVRSALSAIIDVPDPL